MSNISSEKIEKELKSATGDEQRRNKETRSNYWREVKLRAKLFVLPIESFFIFIALLFFPSYWTLSFVVVFLIVFVIASSRGLTMRQLFYYIQSFMRGKKMKGIITLFGYRVR